MRNQIQVVVTGLAWMGSGISSIETAMEQIFREADREVLITSYSISNAADLVMDWFETALARGVLIRTMINRIHAQPAEVIARLESLYKAYPHFYLYDFIDEQEYDLHAKVIVADRRLALVGSSNLSRRGLLNNHELALFVQGKPAEQIASAIDKLLLSPAISRINR
jgi:phosphatidylserine/phosphatidylglycerophosphate/cardiolipin synthase-like enzyme